MKKPSIIYCKIRKFKKLKMGQKLSYMTTGRNIWYIIISYSQPKFVKFLKGAKSQHYRQILLLIGKIGQLNEKSVHNPL